MSVKALLDDVAAEATVSLRIDLAAAHRQADERRSRIRRQASVAMVSAVAVAAVVALIAVLMPGAVFRAQTPPAAVIPGTPTGLPDHWYYAPPWTPPVTRHPMAAASMMLATPLLLDSKGSVGDGPVLVSADGTNYASVPWGVWDSSVSLAPSGRDVAWITRESSAGIGSSRKLKPVVVHRIRLRDGHQQDAELPALPRVERLIWDGDRLIVELLGEQSGFEWTVGGQGLRPISSVPLSGLDSQPVLDGSGTPFASGDRLVSPGDVWNASGTRSAEILQRVQPGKPKFDLVVNGTPTGPLKIPVTGADPIVQAKVLGWANGGIVVRVMSQGRLTSTVSLRMYSPDGNVVQIVSRRAGTISYPIAVAPDVVGTGVIIPGVKPGFSTTDSSHLHYLKGQLLGGINYTYCVMAVVVVLGLVGLSLVRRRRRRGSFSELTPGTGSKQVQT